MKDLQRIDASLTLLQEKMLALRTQNNTLFHSLDQCANLLKEIRSSQVESPTTPPYTPLRNPAPVETGRSRRDSDHDRSNAAARHSFPNGGSPSHLQSKEFTATNGVSNHTDAPAKPTFPLESIKQSDPQLSTRVATPPRDLSTRLSRPSRTHSVDTSTPIRYQNGKATAGGASAFHTLHTSRPALASTRWKSFNIGETKAKVIGGSDMTLTQLPQLDTRSRSATPQTRDDGHTSESEILENCLEYLQRHM